MFGLKKIVPAIAAVIALSIPSLALADDHGRGDVQGRTDHGVVEQRADHARDRVERRDQRAHRWQEARREKRDLDRHEQRLRDVRRDGDRR